MTSAGSFPGPGSPPTEARITDTTAQLPAGGPPGLPNRIVARVRRDVPLALLDVAVVVPAYLVPLVLRFHGAVPPENWRTFWALLPGIAVIHLLGNYLFGLYGQMWRHAGVQEARGVVLSGGMSFVCVLGLVLILSAVTSVAGDRARTGVVRAARTGRRPATMVRSGIGHRA